MLVGQNLMNCAMCKYREQVLGFEAEVGLAQESHHHHVEGIGGGLENCPCGGDCDSSCRDEAFCRKHGLPWTPLHTHGHAHEHGPHTHTHPPARHALLSGTGPLSSFGQVPDHGHSHAPGDDHHHHPYPHADHPLGPKTLPKVPGRLAREEQG
ncbi:MAG: sirohydrochlorin chelatase, partial [Devosia sp.]